MSEHVAATRRGGIGHLVLDRPAAMNALTLAMVHDVAAALDAWEHDDAVRAVVISGAGERGLCAGGDVVAIYRDMHPDARAARGSGGGSEHGLGVAFWQAEYGLNARIAAYPKPYVALMDGVVLGGGVGISAHGSHRVVTERSRVGMPEVTIGFVPDVGATYLLSRAPGELGTHVALTGEPVGGPDAIALGLADVTVPSEHLGALVDDLADGLADTLADPLAGPGATVPSDELASPTAAHDLVSTIIARAATAPQTAPPLLAARPWIDECYRGEDAVVILDRLRSAGLPEATAAADTIARRSPTSVAVTLEALRRSRRAASVTDTLRQDYRVGVRFLDVPDMREGIRAQLIDKDRRPRWSPARLQDVGHDWVRACFDPLPHGDLLLPG